MHWPFDYLVIGRNDPAFCVNAPFEDWSITGEINQKSIDILLPYTTTGLNSLNEHRQRTQDYSGLYEVISI
jgi:hypothetical protein